MLLHAANRARNPVPDFAEQPDFGLCTDAETGTTVLDFRSARQIPTLTDEYGVTRAAKIIVPDDLYESWITADIWKKAASVIVKASEA